MSAEAAVALPALLVVLGAGLWGLGVGGMQARCVTAARSAALAGARGESEVAIAGRVRAALGSTARVSIHRAGGTVSARVTARAAGFGLLPDRPVASVAAAQLEPAGPAP